jgi:hypothetical protein
MDDDPFAVFDAPPDAAGGSDAFDVFDAPSGNSEDPFDVFDVAPTDAGVRAAGKRLRPPPPVLARVRSFIAAHVPMTCADLRAAGSAALAELLAAAASHAASEPPRLEVCRASAGQAAEDAWSVVKSGAETAALAREAYVLAQALLCGVHAALDDAAAALSSLDRAFIVGGPTPLHRDCVELLDEARGTAAQTLSASVAATRPPPPPPPPPPPAALSCGAWREVQRVPLPASAEAFRELHRRGEPLIIEGVAAGWPAMERWANLRWLKAEHGARLVPVELGSLRGGGGSGGAVWS